MNSLYTVVLGLLRTDNNDGNNTRYEVWLSLVERLVWDQDVAGSNPVTSIIKNPLNINVSAGFPHIKTSFDDSLTVLMIDVTLEHWKTIKP